MRLPKPAAPQIGTFTYRRGRVFGFGGAVQSTLKQGTGLPQAYHSGTCPEPAVPRTCCQVLYSFGLHCAPFGPGGGEAELQLIRFESVFTSERKVLIPASRAR